MDLYSARMENSLSRTYYKTLDRVLARLNALKGEWPRISDESGVPRSTIKHIAHRRIKKPDVDDLESLDRVTSKKNGKQKH